MSDKTFTEDEVNKIVQDRLTRDRQARVIREPRVYGPDSPHSYIRDVVRLSTPGSATATGPAARIQQYAKELAYEMAEGSREGRYAQRVIRAQVRVPDESQHERAEREAFAQFRALLTGGGITATGSSNAAAFVTPYFLLQQWAPFRGKYRAFIDQCFHIPLPAYGMEIYTPAMTSAASATEQTEGGSVSESSPSTGLEGSQVKTVTGEIVMSHQMHERGFGGGGAMDTVVGHQILQQLDEKLDLHALTEAITNGSKVTGASEFKTKNFYEDLGKAREELSDTAGTRLRATHMFTTTDFFTFATKQVDATTEDPVLRPWYQSGFPAETGSDPFDGGERQPWGRYMNIVMPGGVVWITDDNIPTFGTTSNSQVVVSAPAVSVLAMEDDPVLSVFVETLANELKVVLNMRAYTAVVTRHAAGTASITGNAYATTNK